MVSVKGVDLWDRKFLKGGLRMVFFSSDWTAVYLTMDPGNFISAKDILSNHNISFRDASVNNQKRLGSSHLFAGNIALSDRSSVKNNYILEVRSKDAHLSRQLLAVLPRV